jgi:hypothetical protein
VIEVLIRSMLIEKIVYRLRKTQTCGDTLRCVQIRIGFAAVRINDVVKKFVVAGAYGLTSKFKSHVHLFANGFR